MGAPNSACDRGSMAVHLLLGHTKLESPIRNLDAEVGEAIEMAKQTEVVAGIRSAAA